MTFPFAVKSKEPKTVVELPGNMKAMLDMTSYGVPSGATISKSTPPKPARALLVSIMMNALSVVTCGPFDWCLTRGVARAFGSTKLSEGGTRNTPFWIAGMIGITLPLESRDVNSASVIVSSVGVAVRIMKLTEKIWAVPETGTVPPPTITWRDWHVEVGLKQYAAETNGKKPAKTSGDETKFADTSCRILESYWNTTL